jgi:SEC-C motif-containing protein
VYVDCCRPLVVDGVAAPTAEALMRSRYTAYAVGAHDHVFRTWHPRSRPADVDPDPQVTWVRLEVLDTVAGGADDSEGEVEFRAHWVAGEGPHLQRGVEAERSRFVRRGGRWVYDRRVGPR